MSSSCDGDNVLERLLLGDYRSLRRCGASSGGPPAARSVERRSGGRACTPRLHRSQAARPNDGVSSLSCIGTEACRPLLRVSFTTRILRRIGPTWSQAKVAVCSTLLSLSRLSLTEPRGAASFLRITTPFWTCRRPSGYRQGGGSGPWRPPGSETQPDNDCPLPPQASHTGLSES